MFVSLEFNPHLHIHVLNFQFYLKCTGEYIRLLPVFKCILGAAVRWKDIFFFYPLVVSFVKRDASNKNFAVSLRVVFRHVTPNCLPLLQTVPLCICHLSLKKGETVAPQVFGETKPKPGHGGAVRSE